MTPPYWQEACEYLSDRDPILEKIINDYEGDGLVLRPSAFHSLARAIVGQQISVKAADSVWAKYVNLTEADPEKTIAANHDDLRACGLSGRKAEYVKNIAEFIIVHNGEWSDDNDEVIAELCTIKGVGIWTAEMFLMFCLGRQDLFPVKDLGLMKAVEKHYEVPHKDMLKFSEKWKPYRTVATWYLWRSLDPVTNNY